MIAEHLALDGGEPYRPSWLPFHKPCIEDDEIAEVVETLRGGWLTTGPRAKRFEREFADYVGATYAVAVNSATAAMHLALEAIGIRPGDEVIVPAYTFTATAEVVMYFGATPVIVDVDPVNMLIDPAAVEAAVTPRTKAIMPVDLAGVPCEYDALREIAPRHNLVLLADSAHAIPTRYKDEMVGTIADITAFSFYVTKPLATGEGGMLVTNNQEWAERAQVMSLHGMSRDAWKRHTSEGSWFYEVVAPGFKYNMTDVAAALGLRQLAKQERFLAERLAIVKQYAEAFSTLPEIEPPTAPAHTDSAWHLYLLKLNLDRLTADRAEIIKALNAENIGTSVHFIPLHLHPAYRERYGFTPDSFPVAHEQYRRVISLPIWPGMSEADVDDVIGGVQKVVRHYGAPDRMGRMNGLNRPGDLTAADASSMSAPAEPWLKRPFDVLLSGLGLLLLGPVLAGIAAAIRLDSPGPVLYRATRSGRFGVPFTMYKFRTMAERRDTHGPKITTHADRRVTRVGRLLRPSRLDELPNLLNVLRGDMSLVVGHQDPHYVDLYQEEDRVVLAARPGVTSLAALLYRDEERLLVGEDWERVYIDEVMPAKLAIDRAYVERQSLWLDLKILAATVFAPLRLERLIDLERDITALHDAGGHRRTVPA